MREKRSFLRFVKLRKMRYLLSGEMGKWQECAIIDLSRRGMKIQFHEGIALDATIFLVLNVPGEAVPINLKGIVKRIEGSGCNFTGGVELTEQLDDKTFIKIMNGYSPCAAQGKTGTAGTKKVSEDGYTPAQKKIPALFSQVSFTNPSFKQAFLFISSSVSLFSLVLFLSLPVFFLMATGYFSGNPMNGDMQKKDEIIRLKGAPSITSPADIGSAHRTTAALDNPSIHHDPALPRVIDSSRGVRTHEGGSLYFLALQQYQRADETLFDLILQANPALTDMRNISADQQITLPLITPESYIKKITNGNYQVHVGTFENMDLVGTYTDMLIYLGKSIVIQPHRFSRSDIWYRILLGSFKTQGEALQAVQALNKKGIIYIQPKASTES
jgi:phage tail protein X